MPTLAFIESNTTGTGAILAEKALRRGLSVSFLSENPERYPYVRDLMLHPRQVDTGNFEAVLQSLRQLDDLVAVLSSSEYFLEMAARAAQSLGLPGADPDAIATCRDKWRASRAWQAAGVPIPRTDRVTTLEEGRGAWERHDGAVVVKPLSGSGSLEVRLHDDFSSYETHLQRLLSKTTNERGIPVQPVALVQEVIEGDEFSVEMLGLDGTSHCLAITAKHLGAPPFFLEVGHDVPAALDADLTRRIESTVRDALQAVGMHFGPTHTEVRLRDGVPVVLEINPRLAGGMIPVLIEQATGVDVLEALLDVFLGQAPAVQATQQRGSSIAFLIPERAGTLHSIDLPETLPDGVHDLFVKVQPGVPLLREGSFRDRIGHVITHADTVPQSRALAEEVRDAVAITLVPDADTATEDAATPNNSSAEGDDSNEDSHQGGNTGRLHRTLHPEAMVIVRKPPSISRRAWELQQLAAIDEAHLTMLLEEGLLPKDAVLAVLRAIRDMRTAGFPDIADSVAPRGTYLLYEGALIEHLGLELGGITHLGRSRNDINATLFRLRLRDLFLDVYQNLWRLRSALLRKAQSTTDLAMPVYSQFQPGLPGTLAYYLLGVERALRRDQEALQALLPALDTSAMGACGGGGSTFAIRPQRVATLLGFSTSCESALDAVASRDLALRLLSAVAISGMHVTRLAQDFQLWTTREFGFLELPDELAGGSSMMPQKKNPYLLEMIKGRATRAGGHWMNGLSTMQGVPFSNSVEVGTEALVGLEDGLRDFSEAARLMTLIVHDASPRPASMQRSIEDGGVVAAAVADGLVRTTGMPFRQAHHAVGAKVTEALGQGASADAAVQELVPDAARPASSLEWAHLYEAGGGPGAETTGQALVRGDRQLDADAAWLRNCRAQWQQADTQRRAQVDALLERA